MASERFPFRVSAAAPGSVASTPHKTLGEALTRVGWCMENPRPRGFARIELLRDGASSVVWRRVGDAWSLAVAHPDPMMPVADGPIPTRAAALALYPLDAAGKIARGLYKGQPIYVPALHALVQALEDETSTVLLDDWADVTACDCHGVKGCACPYGIQPAAALVAAYPELRGEWIYYLVVRKRFVREEITEIPGHGIWGRKELAADGAGA